MLSLYWLDRIQSSELTSVGKKALALSRLKQKDLPVLNGFVIGTEAFNAFINGLDNTESLLADFPQSSLYLDIENYQALQLVARQISRTIAGAGISSDWLDEITAPARELGARSLILRTSPVLSNRSAAAMRGLFPAEIVRNDRTSIETGIKKIWANLFSAKSIFYWYKSGIGVEKVQMAVIVQPAIDALVSGNMSGDGNGVNIESAPGLGHSLSRGEVLPDLYELNPEDGEIRERHPGNKTLVYFLNGEDGVLDSRFLDEAEQDRDSLDPGSLGRLSNLWRELKDKCPDVGSIEWSFTPGAAGSPAELYILSCEPSTAPPVGGEPLKGMVAFGGVVEGTVFPVEAGGSLEERLPPESILVASEIDPRWLPYLKGVRGIITERGGMTSHGAILARELGIVCLVGVASATERLTGGERILIDGYKGLISPVSSAVTPAPPVPEGETRGPAPGTKLMVNLSQYESIEAAVALPIDGLGLLRGEWMILDLLAREPLERWLEASHRQNFIEELTGLMVKFARGFSPRPVFYRSWDRSASGSFHPRGAYAYTLEPLPLEVQLQALRRVQLEGYTNFNLILPFVRGVEEFAFCRDLAIEHQLFLTPAFQLWIMAEVPSVLFLLPELVSAGVQGIAIGSNDLTELILGVSREEPVYGDYFNLGHPALSAVLERLITGARDLNIPCSLCGQGVGHFPDTIGDLVRWGIGAISVEPEAVADVHRALVRTEKRLAGE